jgi:hypothetical protein
MRTFPPIDADDDPSEPDEPLDPFYTEWQERRHRAEMAALEGNWRDGDITAIPLAMRELIRRLDTPESDWEWVLEAVKELVDRRMPGGEREARREFDVHVRRWELVTELYQRRFELLAHGDSRGMWLQHCYEAVAEQLQKENDPAAGSDEAVKKSYRLIESIGGERATFKSYLQARRSTNK